MDATSSRELPEAFGSYAVNAAAVALLVSDRAGLRGLGGAESVGCGGVRFLVEVDPPMRLAGFDGGAMQLAGL